MSKIKEFFESPHIQIALAAGNSIIALAYVSKRVLPVPMRKLWMAFPPFLETVYEGVLTYYKKRNPRICTTWYWSVAILVATALVIVFHLY